MISKGNFTELLHPPKPSLSFRVGILGHRPDRLSKAEFDILSDRVRRILSEIKTVVDTYHQDHQNLFKGDEPAQVRAISPLAEGTDRIFAEQALGLHFKLCCPLPFAMDEYEKDFLEADSLERFRDLIRQAEAVFEMDGDRSHSGNAYGSCGRVVVSHSDLLLVVWDGEREGKTGGTEETLDLAVSQGVPVVLISAEAPHACQILNFQNEMKKKNILDKAGIPDNAFWEKLKGIIFSLIAIPELIKEEGKSEPGGWKKILGLIPGFHQEAIEPIKAYETFLNEKKPWKNFGVPWQLFKGLVGGFNNSSIDFEVHGFEDSLKKDWLRNEFTSFGKLVNRLRPYYAWADKSAVASGDTYRSVFLSAYLLAACAVALALLPVATGWAFKSPNMFETICICLEVFIILFMIVLIFAGRWKRWHERWLDYRLAAELIRHIRLVAPLGGGLQLPHPPAHLAGYSHAGSTWMAWYARSVEREVGLSTTKMNKAHLKDCLTDLIALLKNQANFHKGTSEKSRNIEHRLHGICLKLLALTIGAGVVHYFHLAGGIMTFFCGFLPALGAALEGINNQGEFRRIGMRSESMAKALKQLAGQTEELQKELVSGMNSRNIPFSIQVAALANEAARLMVMEVLDWRVVFLDRPLNPAH